MYQISKDKWLCLSQTAAVAEQNKGEILDVRMLIQL